MSAVTNIALIENTFLIRSGVESLVQEIPGMIITVVFEGNEKNLFEKIKQKKPDLLIVNPNAIKDNFIGFISKIQEDAEIEAVGLLADNCKENISSRFKYILNINDTKHNLLSSLRKVCGDVGHCRVSKSGPLSKREIIVLKEVVNGFTSQEVADKLFLSIHTVMTHRKNITKKLGIKTVSGLMVYSLMNNIIDINEMG